MMRALITLPIFVLTACPPPEIIDRASTGILYRMGKKDGVEMCKQGLPDGGLSDFFPCPHDVFVKIIG